MDELGRVQAQLHSERKTLSEALHKLSKLSKYAKELKGREDDLRAENTRLREELARLGGKDKEQQVTPRGFAVLAHSRPGGSTRNSGNSESISPTHSPSVTAMNANNNNSSNNNGISSPGNSIRREANAASPPPPPLLSNSSGNVQTTTTTPPAAAAAAAAQSLEDSATSSNLVSREKYDKIKAECQNLQQQNEKLKQHLEPLVRYVKEMKERERELQQQLALHQTPPTPPAPKAT